ncbi:DNA polymerase theta [Coccomyxa sp. Obi]|nr:DNA polymerase theta [Coccomyxa sp. Obi]
MLEEEVMYLPAKGQPLRLCLADWGLPFAITQAYAEKGIKEMYPWQAAALEGGLDGSNLVYCAPTSGGKSLVAEILMLRRLLATRKPYARFKRRKLQEWKFALFVLPYISVVAEKAAHFSDILRSSGCKCKGFYGNSENGTPLQPGGEAIAVCTIEKANVAINRLVQENRLDELCCIVIDEVHMLNDPQRGPALELAITKILHSRHAAAIQIVGMSATMGGLDALSKWLNCRLFFTNFRPVSLTEHAVFQGTVFTKAKAGELGLEPQRQLPESDVRDRDLLLPLVAEVVGEAGSVLVFCASRKQCQSCAELIADLLPGHVPPVSEEVRQAREDLAEGMRGAMGGFADAALERLMRAGVAWHHAGRNFLSTPLSTPPPPPPPPPQIFSSNPQPGRLTLEERAHVEAGYRAGSIRVLCATSTLAAGINLPARRVILRSLWQGPGPVSRSQYLQMVGRAGRAGYAEVGESYIIGQGPAEAPRGLGNWHAICELLHEPLPLLQSRLLPQDAVNRGAADLESGNGAEAATAHLQRLLLEAIANGSASGHSDIEHLLCCTLIRHQVPALMVDAAVKLALGSLRQRGLLSFRALPGDEKPRWRATPMGKAVHSSSLPIHLGERLYEELEAGLQNVSMDDLLHPVFLVLLEHPFEIHDWSAWSSAIHSLSSHHRRVASAVGVTREHILIRMSGGRGDEAKDKRHARFAAACAVNALLCEVPAWQVAEEWGKADTFSKAGLSRGQLQKLQADVAGWAAMASQLSAAAGWLNLEPLLMRVSQQATAGTCPELLDLMQMAEVTAAQARALYRAGITNPEVLAATAQVDVERALCAWLPAAMRSGGAARPKDARSVAARVGVTGQLGSNAVVRRSAKLLLTAAREHLLASAQAAWQEGDSEDAADAVPREGAPLSDRCKGDEDTLMSQEDVAEIVR